MIRLFVLLISVFYLVSCNQNVSNNSSKKENLVQRDSGNRIFLQPFGEVDSNLVKDLKKDMQKHLDTMFVKNPVDVSIVVSLPLPSSAFNGKRYKALSLLDELLCYKEGYTHGAPCDVMIGVTDKDISMPLHGKSDYGIMGVTYTKSKVCVISSYRVKNIHDLWKVGIHEYLHARGLKHCDIPECYMKDAKGKGNLKIQNKLCPEHYKQIISIQNLEE